MRIVVEAADECTRTVVVYDSRANPITSFELAMSERAEVGVSPVVRTNVDAEMSPTDAGEVWAEETLDEYRVFQKDE